jgi:amino acid adenylation domain-containing protein
VTGGPGCGPGAGPGPLPRGTAGPRGLVRRLPPLHEFLLRGEDSRPAVVGPRAEWTYGRLREYARAGAAELTARGIGGGERVLVHLEPTPEAIGIMLACSMAGAVYVPVSPATPGHRIRQVAEQVAPLAYLGAGDDAAPVRVPYHGEVTADGVRFGAEPRTPEPLATEPRTTEPRRVLGTDPAYIIFTSGTTGRPKGITMPQHAVVTFLHALVGHCALTPKARVASFAPLSFDFSILDAGLALGSGATLVQVPRLLTQHPPRLLRFLADYGVTYASAVPSVWRPLLTSKKRAVAAAELTGILFAGEAFPVAQARALQEVFPAARLVHCYGQSESIACSFRDLPRPIPPDWDALPIAQAHDGAELMLVGESGEEITEPGRTGELYLRGETLFSGYWADEAATRAALVPNPLSSRSPERVLRTGDLARLTGDGEFVLAGRRDLQVQIRGNRVELEEVERTLQGHPAVAGAAATAVNEGTDLAVYVMLRGAADATEADLRGYCLERLPDYMTPRYIAFVPALPLSETGKLDRAAVSMLAAREPLRASADA